MSGTTPHDNKAPRESAKIVVVSDRIVGGERENTIG